MGHKPERPGSTTFQPTNRPEYGGWVLVNAAGRVVGGPYPNEEKANEARQHAITREGQHRRRV